jgi:hypothetical protein
MARHTQTASPILTERVMGCNQIVSLTDKGVCSCYLVQRPIVFLTSAALALLLGGVGQARAGVIYTTGEDPGNFNYIEVMVNVVATNAAALSSVSILTTFNILAPTRLYFMAIRNPASNESHASKGALLCYSEGDVARLTAVPRLV